MSNLLSELRSLREALTLATLMSPQDRAHDSHSGQGNLHRSGFKKCGNGPKNKHVTRDMMFMKNGMKFVREKHNEIIDLSTSHSD